MLSGGGACRHHFPLMLRPWPLSPAAALSQKGDYKGVWDVVVQTLRREGPLAFWVSGVPGGLSCGGERARRASAAPGDTPARVLLPCFAQSGGGANYCRLASWNAWVPLPPALAPLRRPLLAACTAAPAPSTLSSPAPLPATPPPCPRSVMFLTLEQLRTRLGATPTKH